MLAAQVKLGLSVENSCQSVQSIDRVVIGRVIHKKLQIALDEIIEFVMDTIVARNNNDCKSALIDMNEQFKDPSRDLQDFLNKHNKLELVCSNDVDFNELFGNETELDVYHVIIEIIKTMLHIQNVNDSYPMIYFPISWSKV